MRTNRAGSGGVCAGGARRRGSGALLAAAGLCLALVALGGCSQSLFKRGVHRSQFETYDRVRNRHAADSYIDAFGRRRINLRGRLLPEE